MTAVVYSFSIERSGEEAKVMQLEFTRSADITVEFLRRRLRVPSSYSLEVFVESKQSYELVKNDKDLELITDGSKLKIVKRETSGQTESNETNEEDVSKSSKRNDENKGGKETPTKEKVSKPKDSKGGSKSSSKKKEEGELRKSDEKKEKKRKKASRSSDKRASKNDDKPIESALELQSLSKKKEEEEEVVIKKEEIKESEEPQWKISTKDNEEFQKIFRKLDEDEEGFVTLDKAQQVFGDLGVSNEIIKQVWNLVDVKQLERIDIVEHSIVRFILREISTNGAKIPTKVPSSLKASIANPILSHLPVVEENPFLRGGARGRSNAFYSGIVSGPANPFEPSYTTSGLIRPTKKPKMNNEGKVKSESSRFQIGYAETVGRRPTMEDEIIIRGHFRGNEDEDLIGVFDGHGGKEVSTMGADKLHVILEEKLKQNTDPIICLQEAFTETNSKLKELRARGGSTAIVAYFVGDKGYVANAGDSRAVLCQNGVAIRYSTDHKPDVPEESKRIKDLGGTITTSVDSNGKVISRVCFSLAVARSLGDFQLEPYITAFPEVKGPISLDPQHKSNFLIMACDGLWDVVADQEAVDLIATMDDAEQAAIKLRDTALEKGSEDNVSVVVIRFPPFTEQQQQQEEEEE